MDRIEGQIYKKYFIGKTKPGEWASVYSYKPQNPAIKASRGEVFACISIKGPEDFSVSTAGNLLLDKLHETYFENHKDKILTALEMSVLETGRYLQKLLENDSAGDIGIELDIMTVVLQDDLIYVVNFGNSSLHVFRDGNISEIAAMLKDPSGEGLVKVGSLIAKKGDVFVLGTPDFSEELSTDELLDMVVEFSDAPLKKRVFTNEAGIATIMVGYHIERAAHAAAAIERNEQENLKNMQELPFRSQVIPPAPVMDSPVEESEEEPIDEPEEEPVIEAEAGMPVAVDLVQPAAAAGAGAGFKEFLSKAGTGIKSGLQKTGTGISQKVSEFRNSRQNRTAGGRVPHKETSKFEETEVDQDPTPSMQEARIDQRRVDTNQKTYKVIFDKIILAIAGVIRSVKSIVWDNWLGMGRDSMYLKSAANKRRWGFLAILIVVVIVILYFSIQGITEGQKVRAAEEAAAGHLNRAEELISAANAQALTLAKASGASERIAAELLKLDEAERELAEAKPVAKYTEAVEEQELKMIAVKDLLNKTIAISDPETVVDIAGLFPGAVVSDFVIKDGVIFITDSKNGKVYQVNYTSGTPTELAGGFTNPTSITADNSGNLIVLDQDSERRLSNVAIANGTVSRIAGTSNSRLPSPGQIEFAAIGNGRIYVYDTSGNSVSFLEKAGTGYGLPQKRFSLDEISGATDIVVADLKIYLTLPMTQGIYRSFNNQDDTPTLEGVNKEETLQSASAIFIDDQYVFMADPNSQRVMVFPKGITSMELKAQYTYRGSDTNGFKNIKEIFADKANNRLLILDGSRIYSLAYNQLSSF